MIPKIIHTYYFSKKINKTQEMIDWTNNLRENYPDYSIKVWTLSDIKALFDNQNTRYQAYIDDCLNSGMIGHLYLSYFFRFYIINAMGGFFVEPLEGMSYDLSEFIEYDSVFENLGEENININFFGSTSHNSLETIVSKMLNKFESIRLYNENYSLNIFNPHKILGKCFKDNNMNIWNQFSQDCVIPNMKMLHSVETYEGYYELPKKYKPLVSIVIPTYNAEKYLKECIDSVMNQTMHDFELIFIDDGSTDSTKDIILSYDDDRIVYINKKHSGIVDSLNFGLNRSQGDYIIRLDADDVMLPHRLSHQTKLMSEKNIDVLGGGFIWWHPEHPEQDSAFSNNMGYITMEHMIQGNKLAHPCMCFKRNSIMSLPYRYEGYYKHAEDYKLWLTALSHGLKLYSDGEIITKYRQHDEQITKTKNAEMTRSAQIAARAYRKDNKNNQINELTCIIPFQNEGQEIERTVASIRGTSNVNILLVDDCSTDDYDYEKISHIFGCEYIRTEKNLGVAGCRDFAIKHCNTDYFLLLDGHMRFYDIDWEIDLIKKLKEHPKSIVTGNTLVYSYEVKNDTYNSEYLFNYKKINTRAAFINIDEPGWFFTGKWTNKEIPGHEESDTIPISCCMGAVYACNKTWWEHIGGLKGLEKWGQDEPYMSAKSWLAGGNVLLMKNWGVGHLYRSESAYIVPAANRLKNRVFLIHFFSENENDVKTRLEEFRKLVGNHAYNEAINEFNKNSDELLALKDHFWNNVAQYDLEWFITNINNHAK
jgi:glycosyltransferase involved in cell wall biosynthesis